MKVWVLIEWTGYESMEVIGVYLTKDIAISKMTRDLSPPFDIPEEKCIAYSNYRIYERVLGDLHQ